MTTIAYRDGILAADTQCSSGGYCVGRIVKVVRGPDGSLGAACGDAAYLGEFSKWVLGERVEHPTSTKDSDGSCDVGLRIWPDGKIEFFEVGGSFVIEAEYCALGSGRPIALGAMYAGATAAEAVAAAIEHDTTTGGKIVAVTAKPTALEVAA